MKTLSVKNIFVLFIMLACFVGQSVATNFSCSNMMLFMSSADSSSMMDCHQNMRKSLSITSENNEKSDTSNDCKEKCNCCSKIFASYSLFTASLTFQKPTEALIPFFKENIYFLNTNSLYRPPIIS